MECLLLSMTVLRRGGLLLIGLFAVSLMDSAMAASAPQSVLLAEAKPQEQKASTASQKKQPAQPAAKAQPAARQKAAPAKKAPVRASKTASRKKADAIAAPLPKAKLDLTLPPDMVKEMKSVEQIEAEVRKPLLPSMFGEKPAAESPFQLNGRLLSNEMQLQLRNDSRQDIEGAAIDFEFKQ